MDRNSIIGILLIFVIIFGYQYVNTPSAEEQARIEAEKDSIAQRTAQQDLLRSKQAEEHAEQPAVASVEEGLSTDADTSTTPTTDPDSLKRAGLAERFGMFAPAAEGPGEIVILENHHIRVEVNTVGAKPESVRLKDYLVYWGRTPVELIDPGTVEYGYDFFLGNLKMSTTDLHFRAEKTGEDGVELTAPTTDPNKYLRITYQLDTAWFMHSKLELVGLPEVDPRNMMFRWQLTGFHNEKHRPTEEQKCTVYYKYMNDDRKLLSETKDDEKKLEATINWVAFKQDFFSVAMVKSDGFASNGSEVAIQTLPDDTLHSKRYSAKLFFTEAPADHVEVAMDFYLGPNHFGTLRRTGIPQFHRIIDLGWGIFGWMNRYLVIPIFNFLDQFNLSYGIIILVLTLVIKLLLLPIFYRNQKSSIRMRALRPEVEKINEKYPKKEDAMKKQQATMELYRKAGVSPLAGCVPMLLQLPVLYAMFRFFPSSIELRQQPFLWADDLSSYDSIMSLPFNIPMYGSHVSLFTLLMAASTIIYTVVNSKQMPQQQGMPNMKVMMYIFPVMMLFFLNSYPSGLSYYYLLANLISIIQMAVITKWVLDEEKTRAVLLANMKKPRKKSKWQQRMQEIQKQQQQQQRKKGKRR